MGCCGDREKGIQVSEEQKWDFITLSDFKSTSCFAPFSYAWLWILVLISGAVYAADAFTAVNLLAFNKWSSQVKPKVSFDVAKWIFAITIILSYVFLIYRWIRALRVIRSGSVTECYLEPLAAIWQSMRLTKSGQGWRRFLVFAELTRSRKGADYIALFVYFQFKSALLIVVAQGPRIAINALTLWAVMQAQLIPVGEHAAPKDRSAFVQFFMNIKTMAETGNRQETIIYFTMLFSLVIWVFAALGLLLSAIFYVFFLWHYIPQSDGSLTAYCRRKIETRLERIVGKKIKKALEKEEQKRVRDERKAIKKGDLEAARMPTLPKLGGDDDNMSTFGIQRSDTLSTVSTLPPYSAGGYPSRTNTMSTTRSNGMRPPMPTVGERPPPLRTDTGASYGSNAPLLSQASDMGRSSPAPPMPTLDRNADRLAPGGSFGQPISPVSPISPRGPLGNGNPGYPTDRYVPPLQPVSPLYNAPSGAPGGGSDWSPYGDNRSNITGNEYFEMSPVDANSGPRHYPSNSNGSDDYKPPQLPGILRPGSPAMSQASSAAPSRAGTAPPSNPRAGLPATLQSAMQRREASQPLPNRGMNGSVPQQRSATAPIRQPGWGPDPTGRSNTTTPGPRGYNGYNNGY